MLRAANLVIILYLKFSYGCEVFRNESRPHTMFCSVAKKFLQFLL